MNPEHNDENDKEHRAQLQPIPSRHNQSENKRNDQGSTSSDLNETSKEYSSDDAKQMQPPTVQIIKPQKQLHNNQEKKTQVKIQRFNQNLDPIPQTRIKTVNFNFPLIPSEFKGMIISDLHMGKSTSVPNSLRNFHKHFSIDVQRLKPTCVFILGDVFHISPNREASLWTSFFQSLERYRLPIYLIPGNHDYFKNNCSPFKEFKPTINVHPIDCDLLVFQRQQMMFSFQDAKAIASNTILFGHHIGRRSNAHGEGLIRFFRQHRNIIPREFDNSLLVCGHSHENRIIPEFNGISVGKYCPESADINIHMLSFSDTEGFSVKEIRAASIETTGKSK